MKTYLNYSKIEKDARKKYRNKMKFARYWKSVEDKFRKMSSKESFSIVFKHDIEGDINYDNERIIEEISSFYGYVIENEDLKGLKTIYKFKKVK